MDPSHWSSSFIIWWTSIESASCSNTWGGEGGWEKSGRREGRKGREGKRGKGGGQKMLTSTG